MKLVRLLPLAFFASTCLSGTCEAQSDVEASLDGAFLLKMCSATIEIIDRGDDPAKNNISIADAAHSQFCLGFLSGLNAGHNIAVFENKRLSKTSNTRYVWCTANRKITPGQMVRVVVKFLNDNPQSLDASIEVVAYAAFVNAFPCH